VIPALEQIDWHKFLNRPDLSSAGEAAIAPIGSGPVLVTGAGGSIGSAVARRLAGSADLVLLESSEANLVDLQLGLADRAQGERTAAFYLGSSNDRGLLKDICGRHRPRLVIHTAAYKHVPLLEEHPLAAISNNVFSTEAVAAACADHDVGMILLSTDKAVSPISVMGATKRVAEYIVLASGGVVLRLGNVLASRGSVTEVFARQIAEEMPLTVTDPASRRYFLTMGEAVDLLLRAAAFADGAALFVPHLQESHYIADLARFMAGTLAPDRQIPIEFTQLRAGDKESEEFWSAEETPAGTPTEGLRRIQSPTLGGARLRDMLGALSDAVQRRDVGMAISILREMVPGYAPGAAVLEHQSVESSTAHE
jgi:FlaA1/EpsC-like NDP-sugar epimerase